MRLWLTSGTAVPLRDQISRQISLAILSGELQPGAKLPSVRALGRRFKIHPNTVSSAYRQLQEDRLVHHQRGSGIFVRADVLRRSEQSNASSREGFRAYVSDFVHRAKQLGKSDQEVLDQVKTALGKSRLLVLVEEDRDLIELVLFEIESAGRYKPDVYLAVDGWNAARLKGGLNGRVAAVLPSKAEATLAALGDSSKVAVLEINPIAASFAEHLPRSRDHLVAIASHWSRFREIAKTLLLASGFSAEAILVRVPGQPNWTDGLMEAGAVICDSLTRTKLPPKTQPLVFTLLSTSALDSFPRRSDVTLIQSEPIDISAPTQLQ